MNISDLLQKPDIESCQRLLCIQPHPDDMDISAGGTIARLAEKGIEIIYLTMTDDTAGFMEVEKIKSQRRLNHRKEEQENAGRVLGVKEYHWLDYPDAGDWSQYEARNAIIRAIRQIRPDFVMTVDPWLPYEAHQDHIKCGMAVGEALILYNHPMVKTEESVDNLFEPYQIDGVAFSFTARPNMIIGVDGYREKKFRAIAEHKSQFHGDNFEILKVYDELRSKNLAKDQNFEFGEGFKILNPNYMLHAVPEAVDY